MLLKTHRLIAALEAASTKFEESRGKPRDTHAAFIKQHVGRNV